jgi:hypothetical protein
MRNINRMTDNFSKADSSGNNNDNIFRPDIGGIAQLREKALSSKTKSVIKTSVVYFNDFYAKQQ